MFFTIKALEPVGEGLCVFLLVCFSTATELFRMQITLEPWFLSPTEIRICFKEFFNKLDHKRMWWNSYVIISQNVIVKTVGDRKKCILMEN